MSSFRFRARERSGRIVEGTMEAESPKAVVAELHGSGRMVLDVKEVASKSGSSMNPADAAVKYLYNPVLGGAASDELALFYRQFATMVRSGMTVGQAMASLAKQKGNSRLQAIATETVPHLQGGGKLSDAFARYPWMFPELHINMIRGGETSGRLDVVLDRIAAHLEWETRIRQKLRTTTLYPKLLVLAAILIPSLPTLVLDGFAPYMRGVIMSLLCIGVPVLGIWLAFKLLHQFAPCRMSIDAVKIAIPKIGGMVRMLALSRYYRTVAMLYSTGAPLSQALRMGADSSGNSVLRSRLLQAVAPVERGDSLADALERTEVLPVMAVNMLRTGVATGNVDEMLDKVAEYTESEAEVAIAQTTTVVGVLLLLGVALYIASIIVSFYTGYATSIAQ